MRHNQLHRRLGQLHEAGRARGGRWVRDESEHQRHELWCLWQDMRLGTALYRGCMRLRRNFVLHWLLQRSDVRDLRQSDLRYVR